MAKQKSFKPPVRSKKTEPPISAAHGEMPIPRIRTRVPSAANQQKNAINQGKNTTPRKGPVYKKFH